MRRRVMVVLGALVAIGVTLVATRTTGRQSFRGVIVTSGESGTGAFRHARGRLNGTLRGRGSPRDPDGTCSQRWPSSSRSPSSPCAGRARSERRRAAIDHSARPPGKQLVRRAGVGI
jgi:hypothetical protein